MASKYFGYLAIIIGLIALSLTIDHVTLRDRQTLIMTALGIDENGEVTATPDPPPNFFTADPDQGCYSVKEEGFNWTNAVGTSSDNGREFAPYFWCHMMSSGQDAWGDSPSSVLVWQQSRYDLATAPEQINVWAIQRWRPAHFVRTESRPYLEARCAEFDGTFWGISGMMIEPDDYSKTFVSIWCVRADGELGFVTPVRGWAHFADNFTPFQ